MKILFWVPYPKEGASNRYRVEQYLPYLEKEGIKYAIHSFWDSTSYRILYKKGHFAGKILSFLKGTVSRITDILLSGKYDIVFIHREALPIGGAIFESILFWLKKPVIFDFDDAIFLPSSSRYNNFIEKFKNPNKVADIIKRSSYVIAGNIYLSEFANCYNKNVSVIPTPIDTERYTAPESHSDKNVITVGWIGSITTVDFLYQVRDVFYVLTEKFPDVRIKIVGGDFGASGIPNVISKPWSLEEEDQDLRSFDIGIMPMPDNSWTKGKCAFKAILYMSRGIPCVSSPVGVNKEIITDGVNGFLADSSGEWIDKISRLVTDAALRRSIGLAGRKTIEERYSVKVNAPKFIEIINQVYASKGAKR